MQAEAKRRARLSRGTSGPAQPGSVSKATKESVASLFAPHSGPVVLYSQARSTVRRQNKDSYFEVGTAGYLPRSDYLHAEFAQEQTELM